MQIKHPEWLQPLHQDRRLYGYDQNWYSTAFRRASGCGPTAAAMLLLYLNRRQGLPLPYCDDSVASVVGAMEAIWNYVTPGWMGLASTGRFCRGVAAFLEQHSVAWQCRELNLSLLHSRRRVLSEAARFIGDGLASDCPVAFLNLHKGQASALESWHWIVVTALNWTAEGRRCLATCYDGGRRVEFDLGLWLTTTRLGGGFVYLDVSSPGQRAAEGTKFPRREQCFFTEDNEGR
ncbi:MAG: hypothetical protein E6X17_10505 [Sporomusaceae bacterium]|nr:hypothetical protein [Sporomusaceae bacterium]